MLSYPDGKTINVGDHIWWNGGSCVGYVEDLIESEEQIGSWGLAEPGIAVSNLHPREFIFRKHPQKIGAVLLGGTVVYSVTELADEGVGLLSATEESEFSWALGVALAGLSKVESCGPYCVTVHFDKESSVEHWEFHFLDLSGSVLHQVSVPFRPGTRSA
jgi:hypothetical protein